MAEISSPPPYDGERTLEVMLDDLFLQAQLGNYEEELLTPDHIATSFGVSSQAGTEYMRLLNWRTKDNVVAVRSTLDSDPITSIPGLVPGDPEVLYRVTVEDMFGLPYSCEAFEDSGELHELLVP